MATKNFMDLTNLTQYDGLIKTYINSADAKSIKSIDIDENTVNFYKTDDASGDPAYSVDLADTSGLMPLIENATGDSVVISNSDGTVSESNISTQSLVTGYWGSSHQGEIVIYNGNGQQTVTTTQLVPENIMEKIDSASGSKIVVSDSNGGVMESDYGVNDFLSVIDGAEGDKIVITELDGSISESNIGIDQVVRKIPDATGYFVALTTEEGEFCESDLDPNDIVTGYFQSPHDGELIIYYDGDQTVTHSTMTVGDIENLASGVDDLESLIGTIPQSSSATTVIGYTDEQVAAIEAKLGGVLHYKGVVATVSALPVNAENGDVYHVTDKSAEYAYLVNSGTGAWEELGTVVDLSAYSTTAQMNTAISGAINALDATVSQSAGTDGLALSVTETDGVLTAVSGSIAANTYLKPADVDSISQSDITALFS